MAAERHRLTEQAADLAQRAGPAAAQAEKASSRSGLSRQSAPPCKESRLSRSGKVRLTARKNIAGADDFGSGEFLTPGGSPPPSMKRGRSQSLAAPGQEFGAW